MWYQSSRKKSDTLYEEGEARSDEDFTREQTPKPGEARASDNGFPGGFLRQFFFLP
jgi:hypothetical protein